MGPPAAMMDLWYRRLSQCVGLDPDRTAPVQEPHLVAINRQASSGRHFANLDPVMKTVTRRYGVHVTQHL